MLLKVSLLLICFTAFGETCEDSNRTIVKSPEVTTGVTTAIKPPTTAGENLCDQCDINAIAPVLDDPDNTRFVSIEQDPVDGCAKTYAVCQRTDNMLCDSVEMTATTASGGTLVDEISTGGSAGGNFTCGKDDLYSWKTA
uniref:DUF281 domain-containing protein n=1 Tax=Caenorhabditis tropicalis TaxID=1561998 RepID=A0A1I7TGJ7_9PELO